MSDVNSQLLQMIELVARALGDDLLERTVFVGGVTTGLFVTDRFAMQDVRYTDDVDLIVNVIGRAQWTELTEQLREKGFKVSMEDDVICRLRLGELKVDFMPDDEKILGFSNRWYAKGLETAGDYKLADDLNIRLLTPPLFVAIKLEAYNGRGNDDPMTSQDLEDILILIDGRKELVSEIIHSEEDVRDYIVEQFEALLNNSQFEYAVEGNVRGDKGRKDLTYERMNEIVDVKKNR